MGTDFARISCRRDETICIAITDMENGVTEVAVLPSLPAPLIVNNPQALLDTNLPVIRDALEVALRQLGRDSSLDGWVGYVGSVGERVTWVAASRAAGCQCAASNMAQAA